MEIRLPSTLRLISGVEATLAWGNNPLLRSIYKLQTKGRKVHLDLSLESSWVRLAQQKAIKQVMLEHSTYLRSKIFLRMALNV